MNALEKPVSAQVLEQAIAWHLRLDGKPADANFTQWLQAHPEHARAWAQLGNIDSQLAAAATPLVRQALQRAPRRGPRIKALVALALAVTSALLLQQRPLQHWLADERTGSGEQRALTLADRSQVRLNSRSVLDIQFDEKQRRLVLLAGEILVETAPGEARPFIAPPHPRELRARGPPCRVRREGDTTRLTVLKSAVEARPQASSQTRVVEQGQQLSMRLGQLGPSLPAEANADAWSRGMLVVDDVPLRQLLDQLADYQHGFVELDESLAHLRISGSFPLFERDLALSALPATLPVRIEQRSSWWIRILPAEGSSH